MNNYFAKNLKYLREKKGYDQLKLAEKLNVPQSTLSCWESGIRTPKIIYNIASWKDDLIILDIANFFNVEMDIISRDYSAEPKNNNFDEFDILFSKHKDILTDDDKEYIKFIIEKRKREIDEQRKNGN